MIYQRDQSVFSLPTTITTMSASYHSSDDDSDTSSKAAVREAAAAAEAAATWAWGVKRSQEALGMILRQARDVVEWEIWRRQYDAGDKSYQPREFSIFQEGAGPEQQLQSCQSTAWSRSRMSSKRTLAAVSVLFSRVRALNRDHRHARAHAGGQGLAA